MKRRMAMVLSVVMLLISLPVFAAKEDSAKMQEVLLLVKEKITVPEELSEFSGNVSEYNKKVTYHFSWTSSDYEKSMSVTCDEQGRITSYHQNTFKISEKKLSNVSKSELIAFGEKFLKTTVPEAFASETDLLVYDEASYYASGNLTYHISFQRQKDGIPVKDNYANVYLCVVDDEIQVRSMDCRIVYAAEFGEVQKDVADYQEKYRELFPVEMIYRDEYKPLSKENEPRFAPVLIYRIKDDYVGYMNSTTGEVMTEDAVDDAPLKAPMPEDSEVNMGVAGGGSSLTPQEMEELKKVEGLLDYEDIEKAVKKLPYVNFSVDLKLQSSQLYKDGLGRYYFQMNYAAEEETSYKYFSVRADAKNGEVIELSDYSGVYEEQKALTESQKRSAEKKMTEFLNAVAKKKFAQTEQKDTWEGNGTVGHHYVRMVNDVPYIDNGIRISFDAKNNVVRSYSLDFTEGAFANPKDAVGEETAYEKILEYAPIQPLYIKSEGRYQKVFTLSKKYLSLDAISGEIKNQEEAVTYSYADLAEHWVEEAATKLAEIQVGLPGGVLDPETAITQEEFLRLLEAAVMGRYFNNDTTEEMYDRLMRSGYILEEEKAPESPVKREDAFVYVIRMAGLERVAKLTEIYRVAYGDQEELSEGKLGYAAILSGLGVVCGDGGNLRPQDALTRAEAIAVVYKYLLSF